MQGAGYTIKCPKCKRTGVYVTTDKFDSEKPPNGSMLRLHISTYKGGLTYGQCKGSPPVPPPLMECVDCGGQLCFGGHLIVLAPRTAEFRQKLIDQAFKDESVDITFMNQDGEVFATGTAPDAQTFIDAVKEADDIIKKNVEDKRKSTLREDPDVKRFEKMGKKEEPAPETVKADESNPLACPQCGKVCKSPSGLANHVRKAHKEKKQS